MSTGPILRRHVPPVPLVPLAGREYAARLPVPLTPIVGRAEEVAAAATMLRDPAVRLVTLTGPGGVGKTRLALHLASVLAPEFADGAAFVELAAIRAPELVAPTIAQTLGLPRTTSQPALATLSAALRDREILLVLDNFEQVSPAAPLVSELLQACPDVKALVTSRALLQLTGEHAFPVPPLSLARRATGPGRETRGERRENDLSRDSRLSSLDSEAVQLFVVRSRASNPAFAMTEQNAAVVAEICARLDGLPLAIELAATRGALFSPTALLARLEPRLPLLTGGQRDLPARQQTMRDAIAWSYDLLAPAEQAVFRCLSVFVGGCTLEAAEAVCAGSTPGGADLASDVVEIIESLTRQCLVQTVSPAGDDSMPRLAMLETVREFAAEELLASGEGTETARRHATYFVAFADRVEPAFWGDVAGDWRVLVGAERGNMRAAMDWAIEHGETNLALRLASALFDPYAMEVPQRLAGDDPKRQLDWVRTALNLPGGSPAFRAMALTRAAWLTEALGEPAEGRVLAETAWRTARDCGDAAGLATASFILGRFAFRAGDLDDARHWMTEALNGFRARQAQGRMAWAMCALASLENYVALDAGGDASSLARAEEHCDAALAIFRQTDYLPGITRVLQERARLAYRQRDLARALSLIQELLSQAWEGRYLVHRHLEEIAEIAGRTGQPEVAARLYGAADEERRRYGVEAPPVFRAQIERDLTEIRAALGEAAFAAAWSVGTSSPLEQMIADALAVRLLPAGAPTVSLSPREREILPLLAERKTAREIGEALFLSHRTVENHIANLCAKLGVRTRAEAVTAARAAGLLPTEPGEDLSRDAPKNPVAPRPGTG